MEFAKFLCKFKNQMLPHFFNNYFTKLDDVHGYNTRRKTPVKFFFFFCSLSFLRSIKVR